MSISLKTHKKLWGSSGNCCAFENCSKVLVFDISETDDDISVLGEEAHIVAKEIDGPRGKSDLLIEARDKYNNLILLCHDHHKIIDDHPLTWTIEKLREIKHNHELRVNKNPNTDQAKERDDENYASYIDKIIELCDLKDWPIWSSSFLSNSEHTITEKRYNNLQKLPAYINSRVRPGRYTDLEKSLENLGNIANDLLYIYDQHSLINEENKIHYVERFYKIVHFPQEVYSRLLKEYKFHVIFISDLFLEFTRALNLIFDLVRKHLFPFLRIKEGVLLIEGAVTYNELLRIEYRENDRVELPYKDFKDFMKSRGSRDFFFGNSISKQYS